MRVAFRPTLVRLAADLRELSGRVRDAGLDPVIAGRIASGAELIAGGAQSHQGSFPDPRVCRRCGWLAPSEWGSSCAICGAHALTFERFRPTWWLTEFGPHEVVQRLAGNPALFESAVAAIPSGQLEWKPRQHGWSVVDVLRHVRDADSVLAERVGLILDEDDPRLEFRPVFAWMEQSRERQESVHAILDSWLASRRASVERLRSIRGEDWQRSGRHEELGRVTLLEQASYFAAHELTHLRQIEEVRRAARA